MKNAGRRGHPNRPANWQSSFTLCNNCAGLSKISNNLQRRMASHANHAANENRRPNEVAKPCEPSEIKLKASLGIRLACMESYHPQAIYHRPACVRSGLASPQRAEMDLQKPCQVRTGGLIEARSCELPKLVKWIQQQKDRLRAVFLFSAPSFTDQQESLGSRPGPHGAGPN